MGLRLKDLVEEGVRLVLEAPHDTTWHPDLSGLMRHALGWYIPAFPELGSNPEHLKGFGRDASHR